MQAPYIDARLVELLKGNEQKCNNKSEFHKQIEMREGGERGQAATGKAFNRPRQEVRGTPKKYAILYAVALASACNESKLI